MTVFYVDYENGNDSNNGTSLRQEKRPFKAHTLLHQMVIQLELWLHQNQLLLAMDM